MKSYRQKATCSSRICELSLIFNRLIHTHIHTHSTHTLHEHARMHPKTHTYYIHSPYISTYLPLPPSILPSLPRLSLCLSVCLSLSLCVFPSWYLSLSSQYILSLSAFSLSSLNLASNQLSVTCMTVLCIILSTGCCM